ncbi:GAF domain-containing SpoIIE family protein phosphatase [Actinacidiphila glaucinigra]|uniref:PP2C family protein-serine/threonine phosphatase n=1 Tax=Actinacidiphila glaucinigra TaxID=235986 RepID=UPI002E32C2D2|nr:GAF domain-containing SpoIIE family protein phosphatase [Actinacidiphila glaucinigra]
MVRLWDQSGVVAARLSGTGGRLGAHAAAVVRPTSPGTKATKANAVTRHDVTQKTGGMRRLVGLFGRLVRNTDTAVGMLYVLAPEARALDVVALSGTSRRIAAPWARIALDDAAPVAQAVREESLVWVGNSRELAERFPRVALVAPYEIMLAAAPIMDGGEAWGAVCLLWPVWHPPVLSPGERDAIGIFCGRAGRLLRHYSDRGQPVVAGADPLVLRAVRRREPGRAEALAAYDFAERLPTGCCSLDLEGRVRFLNAAAADLLGAGAADLLGSLPWERLLWVDDPAFEDAYRAAVISKQSTSFTALRPPDQWLSFRLVPGASGVSVTVTPAAGEPEQAADGPVLPPGARGPVGASAMYQLMYLAATLTEAVGVQDVVDQVADQLVPAFEAQGLVVLTAEGGRLRVVGHRGYSDEFMAKVDGTPLTSSIVTARALSRGTPLFFTSFADLHRAYPQALRFRNRDAWAFLPLITSGRPVGLLVLSYDRSRPFPQAERNVLIALAGLIAQALDRAHLYDTKHQLARTLQTGLLPKELPRIPGLEVAARYLPAGHGSEIGGDFYDLIHCGPRCAAVTIGDVQGHNLQAAALMGQVRIAVHAHATAHSAPGDVLARTNRLLSDLDPGLFTSCLFAHIDLERHIARLATAGHPPPLIRRPDGSAGILGLTPGLLLGIAPDGDYPTTEIPLPPGTLLALYTDGLVESPGVDAESAAGDLVRHLVATADLGVDAVADSLLEHALRTAPGTDDTALLIARPSGPGGAPPADDGRRGTGP